MASLFKPTVSTYLLSDGKSRTPDGGRVTKSTPGAIKVSRKSEIWYGKYKAANGRFRKMPLCTDKTASKQMLAKLVVDAKMARLDMTDIFEEHGTRLLVEHVDDYRRYLEAEGNCREYVAQTNARIRTVLDGCQFAFIADLAAEKVAEFLHGLRRDPPRPALSLGQEWFTPRELVAALNGARPRKLARLLRRERLVAKGNGKARKYPRTTVEALQDRLLRGIGISTSNGYLVAIKGFARWLVEKERMDRDRLVSLSRLNAETDPRHARRSLAEPELQALLSAAGRSTAVFDELTGPERMMLYATAMVTGFRASELASLSARSFDSTPTCRPLRYKQPTAKTAGRPSSHCRRTWQWPYVTTCRQGQMTELSGRVHGLSARPKWCESTSKRRALPTGTRTVA